MSSLDALYQDTASVIGEVSTLPAPIGAWKPGASAPVSLDMAASELLRQVEKPLYAVLHESRAALAEGGVATLGDLAGEYSVLGYVPGCLPQRLGDPTFCADLGIKYPYVAGAMANGIASEALVQAMCENGMLGIFGAAGLSPARVESAIDRLSGALGDSVSYGFNLIHSPNEKALESEVVDLYLRRGIRLVEASAYIALSLPVVRYRVTGIYRDDGGRVVAPNRIIAKVSRVEVATRFFDPPPQKMLAKLVEAGDITKEQAEMASEIPMAQDITAEADSGGHTDNRPAVSLLPTLCALRDRIQQERGYSSPLRVGLGGGIATPASAAAAFAMGAAYVVTGTINQSCVEAGTSDEVRRMLADARQADVAMAPAADMFEMGVQVQVLKRGTMFSMRASKLYELYRAYDSLEEIPPGEREKLEKTILRASCEEVWNDTERFFSERDPRQLERAARDPKHKMALVFRWYLGQASHWANRGEADRKVDYQVWCGPAMGAFNEWAKGSFLEGPEHRSVVTLALNILYGACVLTRVNILRSQGVPVGPGAAVVPVLEQNVLRERLKF